MSPAWAGLLIAICCLSTGLNVDAGPDAATALAMNEEILWPDCQIWYDSGCVYCEQAVCLAWARGLFQVGSVLH